MKRVRAVASWSLNPGVLKHFAWTQDFSPSTQHQSTTQVWLRIYGLAQEYWRKKILFAIACSVGTPICTDSITNKPRIERSFGHFARVLIDLDRSQELRYRVLVERKGFAFFVDFEYENLPEYCTHCNCTGHSVDKCKRLNEIKGKKPVVQQVKLRPVYVPKAKVPESIPVISSSKTRSKDDLELENEINEAISKEADAHNLAEQGRTVNTEVVAEEEDILSSDGSEFVEATQQNFESDSSSKASDSQMVPAVHRDIDFLKKSWANLAEMDDFEPDQADMRTDEGTNVNNLNLVHVPIPVIEPVVLASNDIDDDGF